MSSSVALTLRNFGLLIHIILSSDPQVTEGFSCKNSARSGWFGVWKKNSVAGNHKAIDLCWQIRLESALKIIEKRLPWMGQQSASQTSLLCLKNSDLQCRLHSR